VALPPVSLVRRAQQLEAGAFREAHSRPNPASSLSLRFAGKSARRPFHLVITFDLTVRRPLIRMTTGELVSDQSMAWSPSELQHLELIHSVQSSSKRLKLSCWALATTSSCPRTPHPGLTVSVPHTSYLHTCNTPGIKKQSFLDGLKNFGFLDTTFKLGRKM
jgi:hypothetical protein